MAFPTTVSEPASISRAKGKKSLSARSQSRSFTNLGNAATNPENKSSAGSTLNSGLGHGKTAWGSGNIWGTGSLASTFASRATTREPSRSRDLTLQLPGGRAEEVVEGKTGSGSLVGTSVLDDMSYHSSYAAQRNGQPSRAVSQARYPETASSQPRSLSNAGIPQSFSASRNTNSLTSRPPTISLNATSTAPTRQSFGSGYAGGFSGRGSDPPPNVYTKFDRPVDQLQKKPDSAIGSWAEAANFPSPTDDRRPHYPTQNRTVSVPASRDASIPASHHSDERPVFSRPDYARSAQMATPSSSRAPSMSSQRNGSFTANWNSDAMSTQLAQLRLGGDSRPTTSYRPSPTANGFSSHVSPLNGIPSHGRNGFANATNGAERSDDVGEYDRFSMSMHQFDPLSFMSPQQAAAFAEYTGSAYDPGFLHEIAKPGAPYSNGSLASRALERSPPEWQGYGAPMCLNGRGPTLSDVSFYSDPRMQQLLAAQLRNPYASAMFNAYNMQHGMPVPPFVPIGPAGVPSLDPGHVMPVGKDVQSLLLYEFKTSPKSKNFELRDISDHVAEFSGDQYGSRFIQTKLETANSDDKDRVFREIQPNAIPLMTDVFGNYVIQKFFEHGDQTHKKILANKMQGRVLDLSLQMYGCRVVQKALDHVLVDQKESLIGELKNNVLKCVKDQNGNHVIQKAIESCPSPMIGFIVASFRGQVQHLSIHPYGCRVIQRCLEHCDAPSKAMILSELLDGIPSMISDQYGNYVVQNVVSKDEGQGRQRVLEIVARGLEGYSKHKFASNVVETCLENCDDQWRRRVVFSLTDSNQRRVEGDSVLVGMIKDNFGNYVIRESPSFPTPLCTNQFCIALTLSASREITRHPPPRRLPRLPRTPPPRHGPSQALPIRQTHARHRETHEPPDLLSERRRFRCSSSSSPPQP